MDCTKITLAMESIALEPRLVAKESIPSLSFKNSLLNVEDVNLNRQIDQAVRLGNAYQSKVSITFVDDEGLKRVETTIWAKGEQFISLKGGVWLPISRIVSVNF